MNLPLTNPNGDLVRADDASYKKLSLLAKRNRAVRLGRGMYAIGAIASPEQITRHHLNAILGLLWPGAVLCGKSAILGGAPANGLVFFSHSGIQPRTSKVKLPGVTLVPVVGPGGLPGDVQLPGGILMSGSARRLVENVDVRGRPGAWRAGTATTEDLIDDLARSGGAGRVQEALNELDVIAGSFDPTPIAFVRTRLTSLLGSFPVGAPVPTSARLAARLAGVPFDGHRVEMIDRLLITLQARPPRPTHVGPPVTRWEWLSFFEAYFSNFIEGTEFGVEEARRIAVDGLIPVSRPADAHDVAATYRLAGDPADRVRVPQSGAELISILQDRHRILMASRGDKRPGQFKEVPNYAGGYQFVEPNLVVGTLVKGFELMQPLVDPFARAVAMMVLVTECHPFDDGNGRVARLMVNAELSAAGQVRLCIPTVYRIDYLSALTGFSNDAGSGQSLVAVLEFAQRWTSSIDWSSFEGANRILSDCNAYLDPGVADRVGKRLILPPVT